MALIFLDLLASGTAFDVEAATRMYLDTLQGPARAQSDAYFEGTTWLLLWGTLVTVAIDWLVLRFKMATAFRSLGEKWFNRPFLVTWVTALLYLTVTTIFILPWSIYTDYLREKQYDLLDLAFMPWVAEQVTGFAIGLIIGPLAIALVYSVIRRAKRTWWMFGTAITGLILMLGMMVAPVFISPLFNTFSEMEEGPLKDRIVAMAREHDVPAEHIYVFDQSKQDKRISANVSGFGPTIRISLNDNLLERTTDEEVVAVTGHELGHYVLNHGPWRVATMMSVIGLGLFLASRIAPWMIRRFGQSWGIRDIGDPASIPVLSAILTLYFLMATPALNNIIRLQESQADDFGLDTAAEPDAFARAAMRLAEYRKLEPTQLEEFLFYTHPSGETRVRKAMQWKAENVPDAKITPPPEGYLNN
ncbi:MAG: M48 family metallopeptidase [Erythrobacter sp.]